MSSAAASAAMPEVSRAAATLRETAGDRLRTDFPLAPLTTFRIGGPAALFLEPESQEDLDAVNRAVSESGIEWMVIGKGSNILVGDKGFAGLVLRLGKGFRWTAREGNLLKAGASMPVPALAGVALTHQLSGLEFGVAIPASLGGAVRMNAGAHGGSVGDVVSDVEVFIVGDGARRTVSAADAGFVYRSSSLPAGAIVTAATLNFSTADPAGIRERMDEARDWRRRTQPLSEPNCGSVFKNPPEGHAAQMVEESGAKGLAIGGARVSEKHSNFIVASPGATSADVSALIDEVREKVDQRFGVQLELEVRFVGDF